MYVSFVRALRAIVILVVNLLSLHIFFLIRQNISSHSVFLGAINLHIIAYYTCIILCRLLKRQSKLDLGIGILKGKPDSRCLLSYSWLTSITLLKNWQRGWQKFLVDYTCSMRESKRQWMQGFKDDKTGGKCVIFKEKYGILLSFMEQFLNITFAFFFNSVHLTI